MYKLDSGYLNFIRVDFEGDGGVGRQVGGLLLLVVLVQLLVELADVFRHYVV